MRALAEGWTPGWGSWGEDYEVASYALCGCRCFWKEGREGCGSYLVGAVRVGFLGLAVVPGVVGTLADEGVGVGGRGEEEDLGAGEGG